MYNYEQNNFTTVTPDAMYSSICVKGGIWFGGDNTICYYDYKDKTLKNIPIKKEDKEANPVDYRVQKCSTSKRQDTDRHTEKRNVPI